jgi:hypothetical protein
VAVPAGGVGDQILQWLRHDSVSDRGQLGQQLAPVQPASSAARTLAGVNRQTAASPRASFTAEAASSRVRLSGHHRSEVGLQDHPALGFQQQRGTTPCDLGHHVVGRVIGADPGRRAALSSDTRSPATTPSNSASRTAAATFSSRAPGG